MCVLSDKPLRERRRCGRPDVCCTAPSWSDFVWISRRSVCDWHYHFFCISVSRKFRFFESFFRKIGKTSGNCNVIRHFLENLWKSEKFSWKSAKIAMKSHFKMQNFTNFFGNACKICKKFDENLLKFCEWSGAKVWKSCRSRKSWKNEYLVAIVAVHTAENETLKVWITDLSDHTLDHIPNLLYIYAGGLGSSW